MTLDEVLSLEIDKKSIRKIDMFLKDLDETSYDYIKALSYKALILHKTDKTKDSLKILLPLVLNFKKYDNDAIISILDVLIDIFFDTQNYDQALKYIEIKKDNLKTIDKDKYLYDMIRYYENISNKNELKRTIILYLSEDIKEIDRISALEKLIDVLFYENSYDLFKDNYYKLLPYYEKNHWYEKTYKLKTRYAIVLFKEEKYDETLSFIDTIINDEMIDIDSKISLASIKLKIFLIHNENRKAMIFESEYHDIYLLASKVVALDFAKVAKEVSIAISNRVGAFEYSEAIETLEEEVKELKKAPKKEKKKTININIIEDEISSSKEVINIEMPKEEVKETSFKEVVKEIPEVSIEVSKRFSNLEGILKALSPKEGYRFRDLLINFGSEIDKVFSNCEIVICTNYNGEGFHYKMNRVYEKTFVDSQIIGSPFEGLLGDNNKILLFNVHDTLFNKNIITNAPFSIEFKSVFGFSLYKSNEVIGGICYNFKTDKFDDIYVYEILKILSSIINIYINQLYEGKDVSHDVMMYEFIFKNSSFGLKNEIDKEIKLNEVLQEIIGCKKNKILDEEYLTMIMPQDRGRYKELYRKIYEREVSKASIFYHINNKYVKEDVMVLNGAVLEIYSIISDETYVEEKELKLKDQAYNNQISKLKNINVLYDYIDDAIEAGKFSCALISNVNYKTFFDIYGYKFASDLTLLIGKILKDIENKDIDVFHLESDKFFVLIRNTNDLRVVKKMVLNIIDKIISKSFEVNKRLKLDIKAGIYRHVKTFSNIDAKKVVNYASEALIDAVNEDLVVALYDKEKALLRFKDSQIALYASEAIDLREIKLDYKEVCNIKDEMIEYYIPKANLRQFDCAEEYFYSVVEKRDIKKIFDKYIINETLFELKTFYDKYKVYYPTLIPLHKSVIFDKRFKYYFEQKLKYMKISPKILGFYIINDTSSFDEDEILYFKSLKIDLCSDDFTFTIKNKLDIFFCDMNVYNLEILSALKKSCDELGIRVYAKGVKSKKDIKKLEDIGVYIVSGDFLKTNTIDTLIKEYQNDYSK